MKKTLKLISTALFLSATVACGAFNGGVQQNSVEIQQIRNATMKITYADTTFLIDPMLSKKGAMPGFAGTPNSHLRNPLVELPLPVEEIVKADAIIVTHTHEDHWDTAAQQQIPKNIPIFAQHAADAKLIRDAGFTDVRLLSENSEFNGVRLIKTGGQHGTDEMMRMPQLKALLGEAAGVVFQAPQQKTIYLVGDTIWRPEVETALRRYQPEIVILNSGNAQVSGLKGSIIMDEQDVYRTSQVVPNADIVATHMEAVNHALLSRKALAEFVEQKGIAKQTHIPQDGETLQF
ncbi:hypothetical protein A1D23_08915 [Chelonobacter oris]|uniref:Metallo-beta-lactamase domain-containing protein n=1 Tax=Chelonobacter oris TaxID=505317 RepID=A0A0A3APG0_9PAST|nr:MBL fold metallo-hydrolase [Chelonobacter oris]KGQ69642.1 hypothetical protein OA57_10285 [Chelonobacter oris]MDH3000299.1 hypothetical protein [Chelonobacter oris]